MPGNGDHRDAAVPHAEKENWDRKYREHGMQWGESPSVLRGPACSWLSEYYPRGSTPRIVDLGCGYGRDSLVLAGIPGTTVTGIDSSPSAIGIARGRAEAAGIPNIEFICCDFFEVRDIRADILYCCNIYHLLCPDERAGFCRLVDRILLPGGLFFMSTLSVRDPEHFGKGEPVEGEENTYVFPKENMYLHFCTREELEHAFSFLEIREIREIEYIENREQGDHHHVSCILVAGRDPGNSRHKAAMHNSL